MKDSFKVGLEARLSLQAELNIISEAIGSTLGPGGRPFGFEKLSANYQRQAEWSKDGLTVLNALKPSSPEGNAVIQYCRSASAHSVIESGDGPQPLHSKILTPKGFVTMADMKVGMEICGTDGTIQTVLAVLPKGDKEIYEVEFANIGIVECCADHLWTVTDSCRVGHPVKTLATNSLMTGCSRDKYHEKQDRNYKLNRYYTPQTVAQFYDKHDEMPLDPYLLGVLIGDGSLSGTGSIEICIGKKKEHIIEKLKLPEDVELNTKYVDKKNSFRIKFNRIKGNVQENPIHGIIKDLGLWGTTSATKFIPKAYLYSSIETRQALLQGLMDTDGSITSKGFFDFSSVSQQLASDVVELFRSLGMTVRMRLHERTPGISYSMTPIYRIVQLKGYNHGDKITSIKPTGRIEPVQCIKVSNPDNLYITDGYVVTHNTSSTIILASAVCNVIMKSNNKFPQAFARLIERDAAAATKAIREEAITTPEAVRKVTMTSSNGDAELTDVVLEAVDKSSALGTIIVNKNPASRERYKISTQDGYSNCKGYEYNQVFALSADSNTASSRPMEWRDATVMIYNGDLIIQDQVQPLLNAWQKLVSAGQSNKLVIVAFQISDEIANRLMVLNRQYAKEGLAVFVVQPRLTAEINAALHIIRDIAAYCGIPDQKIVDGGNVKSIDETYFGTCKNVRVGREGTAFLGRADNHWVEKRILQNKSIWEEAKSDFDREITKIRNAELAEGLVTVVIGGGLLADLGERADRFDDAAKAAKACKMGGALPGAGCSYIRAGELANVNPDLKEALREVNRRVLENYGVEHDATLFPGKGMTTAITEDGISYVDAFDSGILDATETVCSVIKNGVSLGVKIATMGGYFFTPPKQG